MKIQTADEKFAYSFWIVMDKIREAMIPDKSEIMYLFDLNVRRSEPITFMNEGKAIKFLLSKGVIRQIGDPVLIESGNKGSTGYSVAEEYHFKIIRKRFLKLHKFAYIKAFSKAQNKNVKLLVDELLVEMIKGRKIGRKQAKLLLLLKNLEPVSRSVLISRINTQNLTGLVRDTKKSIKKSEFAIELVRSHSISKENSYRLVVSFY